MNRFLLVILISGIGFLTIVTIHHSTYNVYACEFGSTQFFIFMGCVEEQRWRDWCFSNIGGFEEQETRERWVKICANEVPDGIMTDAGRTDDLVEFSPFNLRFDYPKGLQPEI